jgi:hypothetical protein
MNTITLSTIAVISLLINISWLLYLNNKKVEKLLAEMIKPDNEELIIAIKKVDNGYICSYNETVVNGEFVFRNKVIKIFDNNIGDLMSAKNMFVFVKEFFNIHYVSENDNNLEIVITEKEEPLFNKLTNEDKEIVKNIYKKYVK